MSPRPLEIALNSPLDATPEPASMAHGLHLLFRGEMFSADRIAELLQAARPQPRYVSWQAHNIPDAEAFQSIKKFADQCRDTNTPFFLDFLLPDTIDVPGVALARENPLADIIRVSRDARQNGLVVRWIVPLTPELVYRLDGAVNIAQANDIEPVLLPTVDEGAAKRLSQDDRQFAWDFITYRVLDEDRSMLSADRVAYYQELATSILGGTENSGLAERAFSPSPPPAAGNQKLAQVRNILGDLADVIPGAAIGYARSRLLPVVAKRGSAPSYSPEMPIASALLIGANGCDHIGDAAILGGVLLRLHRRHGTQKAVLMTQRVAHTKHLVAMLETPVSVEVREYTLTNIRTALKSADGLVHAGGPLTDLPKQLARHIYAASLAKQQGKPFIMEGIGPSGFPRRLSQITARRYAEMADNIVLRTHLDAGQQVIDGLSFEIGHDPAFDYLATRADALTKLYPDEPDQIDDLLKDTESRFVVGINIRPIRHLYTQAAAGEDKVARTQNVEATFEAQFAAGLIEFAKSARRKPCFVFFPMNAIQFGMSDLRSAHRIMAHLPPDIDFRLWERDASLDGVVALLRRVDAVITMRFHATIFALSQGKPVTGIDYAVGKPDKVAAVMTDAGFPDDWCQIDELKADWLSQKLTMMADRGKNR